MQLPTEERPATARAGASPGTGVRSVVEQEHVGHEAARGDLEKARAELELTLKRVELELKRVEPEQQRHGSWKSLATSPLTVAIAAGVVGLLGAVASNFLQARSTLSLEREKFESSLILKAIETGDPEDATRNLLFLKNVGLIRDPSGKIAALEKAPASAPVLPSPTSGSIPYTNYRDPMQERDVTEIILHDTMGSLDAVLAVMKQETTRASAHYIIGKDGKTITLLDENLIAFHARAHNNGSVGIELERVQLGDTYPSAQMSALTSLLTQVAQRHRVRTDDIRSHWEVDSTKRDGPPNPLLQQIREEVGKRLKE